MAGIILPFMWHVNVLFLALSFYTKNALSPLCLQCSLYCRCFTAALTFHVPEDDRGRLSRKVSNLLQLALIPPESKVSNVGFLLRFGYSYTFYDITLLLLNRISARHHRPTEVEAPY